jgi:diacylglycerol kinase (ATP)
MSIADAPPACEEHSAIEQDGSGTRRVEKATGISHLFAALGYSVAGARRLFDETAFRHEISASVVIFVAFLAVGAHSGDFLVMAVLLLVLSAAEAFNTAIEEIVDRISPEWSHTAMHAKDLGSFAVFCLLAANGLVALFVIGSRLLSV